MTFQYKKMSKHVGIQLYNDFWKMVQCLYRGDLFSNIPTYRSTGRIELSCRCLKIISQCIAKHRAENML